MSNKDNKKNIEVKPVKATPVNNEVVVEEVIEEVKEELVEEVKEEVKPVEEEKRKESDTIFVRIPIIGKSITLKNTDFYVNPYDKNPAGKLNGKFYYYDEAIINDKIRISNVRSHQVHEIDKLIGYVSKYYSKEEF